MSTATNDQIVRLFPGIQDHAVIEILNTNATVDELEAAMLLLQSADEGLIDIKQREGDRINRLLNILGSSELRPQENRDR